MSGTQAQCVDWSARRKEVAAMPRSVLECALLNAEANVKRLEIDLEIATKAIQGQAASLEGWGQGEAKGARTA